MIKFENDKKNISTLHINGHRVLFIYMRGRRIWPNKIIDYINDILSCYYNGYWIDEYPWTDNTPWKD